MKEQALERKKAVAIGVLFATSAAITLTGLAFGVYSAIYRVEFPVMDAKVPGAAFGMAVAFLGVRYFLSVQKLKRRVYQSDVRFSWDNFKRR